MELPLLDRMQQLDVAHFPLLPAVEEIATGSFCGAASADQPLRMPDPGEQYRFHFDMTKCIGCKCCVVACNEQNGNPADILWRRVGEIEGGPIRTRFGTIFPMGCNHCLEPTCMTGCPVDAYYKGLHHRHRASQCRCLHRMPVLHVELFVRCTAVQPGTRRGGQMRHVLRTPDARSGPGMRVRVS